MKWKFLVLIIFLSGLATAQTISTFYRLSATSPTAGSLLNGGAAKEINSGTIYRQISWHVSGTISSCSVSVDSSADDSSWSVGGAIGAQTCTSNGSSGVLSGVFNYTRINITVLSGGGTIVVTYNGFPTAPSGSAPSTGLVISSAGISPIPSPLATRACPTGEAPFIYGLNGSAQYQDLASWDTAGTPPSPAGQITFCWPLIYNDTGTSIHANRAFTVQHIAGNGGLSDVGTLDDSAIMGILNNTGSQQDFHQLLTFYAENVLTGNPTFHGHAGAEHSGSVYRGNFTDSRTDGLSLVNGDMWVSSMQFQKLTTSTYNSCASGCAGGLVIDVDNQASGNQANAVMLGINTRADNIASPTNLTYAGIKINAPVDRFPTNNYGLWLTNHGTNAADFNMVSEGVNSAGTAAGFSYHVGPFSFGQSAHAASGYQIDSLGAVKIKAGTGVRQLDLFGSTSGSCGLSTDATSTAVTDSCPFNATKYQTGTNCAAIGTINNPSVVSCSAAPAGTVYCDVAASGGTCTVNTTAVTSTSRIFITLTSADNTELSPKTCNSSTISSMPAILYASKVAGTSFTINMPTLTTNGPCFEYFIVN